MLIISDRTRCWRGHWWQSWKSIVVIVSYQIWWLRCDNRWAYKPFVKVECFRVSSPQKGFLRFLFNFNKKWGPQTSTLMLGCQGEKNGSQWLPFSVLFFKSHRGAVAISVHLLDIVNQSHGMPSGTNSATIQIYSRVSKTQSTSLNCTGTARRRTPIEA